MEDRKVVYILGAGATKAVISTAPLMTDLLPGAFELLERYLEKLPSEPNSTLPDRLERLKRIKKFVYEFYLGQPEDSPVREVALPNLEDVLSQVDIALLENRPLPGEYNLDKLRKIRADLTYAICEVLRKNLGLTNEETQYSEGTTSTKEGRSGMNLMRNFLKALKPEDALVSLNYDLVADNAMYMNSRESGKRRKVDYVIPIRYVRHYHEDITSVPPRVRQPDEFSRFRNRLPPLYKLHGSLNWVYCSVCQQLDVTEGRKGVIDVLIERDDGLLCPDCKGEYEPLIIAPTLLKIYSNILLNQLWRQAEEEISQADEVVFIGYSLADADVQLKCMLKRAFYKNKLRREAKQESKVTVTVVTRPKKPNDGANNTDETCSRYKRIFGEITCYEKGFESYINESSAMHT